MIAKTEPPPPRCDNILTLPGGRRLGYAEWGHPKGTPIFYFHGFPGSRFEAGITHPLAYRASARIISLDRPGYGLSDPQPSRTFQHWPRDVAALATHLRLERFAILGISGGSPYAAACAAALSERVICTGIVCGVSPFNVPGILSNFSRRRRIGSLFVRHMPWLLSPLYRMMARRIARNPLAIIEFLMNQVPEPDRQTLAHPDFRENLSRSFHEAFRTGSRGFTRDLHLYCSPWDIPLGEIRVPTLLWHGELDGTVPVEMGRFLASSIPNCKAKFLPAEGHYSLPGRHMTSILAALLDGHITSG